MGHGVGSDEDISDCGEGGEERMVMEIEAKRVETSRKMLKKGDFFGFSLFLDSKTTRSALSFLASSSASSRRSNCVPEKGSADAEPVVR